MSVIAVAAYKKGLGPHHPWALQKIAGVAMKAIKRRDKLIKCMCDEQTKVQGREYVEKDVYDDFKILSEECGTLSKHLTAFCKERGLDQLP